MRKETENSSSGWLKLIAFRKKIESEKEQGFGDEASDVSFEILCITLTVCMLHIFFREKVIAVKKLYFYP